MQSQLQERAVDRGTWLRNRVALPTRRGRPVSGAVSLPMVEEKEGTDPSASAPPAVKPAPESWRAFPSGLHLVPVTATPPEGKTLSDLADPFVPLGDRGRFSRT